ncbi:hypothetical protein [Streptomyces sp. NPDC088131]|uniref:hypothetical protein n=1 Tax=Streptomyces sp. NPDC088131 TaxID=3365826 RepID=UPI0037FCD707
MTTSWSGAELRNGGSSSYDRKYGAYWSSRQNRTHGDTRPDHYAEKAAARERDQRRAQEDDEWGRSSRERDERAAKLLSFRAEDPEPWPLGLPSPDDSDNDIFQASAEQSAWQKRRDEYLMRAEGEELAARISRR